MRLSHRLYYLAKPLLPRRARLAARRVAAARERSAHRGDWPINQSASVKPIGWKGWPDGRQFAFVLTHDVEGPSGLARVQKLAELEMSLGFRSSFNLIPEGSYTVPPSLRAWLHGNGFETGVHDLHHNGKLFSGRDGFRRKAARINGHLRDWQAVGFRAGFMLRNLDWIHDLDIQYDASTFDTDPFEPQSDGTGTIFPYWIAPSDARPNASAPGAPRGYVELPYTLPQDSTLFLILQEKSPEIWLRKLDWVAQHGGMALVNVHPDYMCFDGATPSRYEFPARFYTELLTHVTQKYAGRYWSPLPRELARWYRSQCISIAAPATHPVAEAPAAPGADFQPTRSTIDKLRGKRAAVLLYSRYPADPRPRRAAEAMIEAGMKVDLLCLSGSAAEPAFETVGGVQVFRTRLTHRRDSKWLYIWQYGRFFLTSFWFLIKRGLRHRYDVVHVHNMPDFLAFATLLPKLRGARVILDLHDPMPELMESIYGLDTGNWKVRLLRSLERWSIGFSDLVATPNITFKKLFLSRSCPPEKMQLVMNSPQPEIFDPVRYRTTAPRAGENSEFRVMHHGLIAHRHGVDLLVEAIAKLKSDIPAIRLDIYGAATPFLDIVLERATALGIRDLVRVHGAKSQSEIAAAIDRCHLGVVPNRRSTFTELNFPTRLFEYLALGRPVIAPNTQGIRDYFGPDEMVMFEPGDVDDLAAKIKQIHDQPELGARFVTNGAAIYHRHLWVDEKRRFLESVATVL